MTQTPLLIENIGRLVTMEPGPGREGTLGVIADAAVQVLGDKILWAGPAFDLPKPKPDGERIDAGGAVVMPGLVDCHTHLVHGGWRQNEFNERSKGKGYQEIAAEGGGIMSTVRATRAASSEELLTLAAQRADEALSCGTTTIEIKTGYGLEVEAEAKMAAVARDLGEKKSVRTVVTFLGAHVVPAEYRSRRAEYLRIVTEEMIPLFAQKRLATSCDAFVEEGAFTPDEARLVAAAAAAHRLPMRLHVDQFGDGGGALLAAEMGALSAEHLDFTSESGMIAMRDAGVVAVCLPGASFFAGKGRYPDARRMIDLGLAVAVATDYNPGTNPSVDLFMSASIAVARMGMTCDEALLAITKNAAAALRLSDCGSISPGRRADLIIIEAPDEYFPLYRYGARLVSRTIAGGRVAFDRSGGG